MVFVAYKDFGSSFPVEPLISKNKNGITFQHEIRRWFEPPEQRRCHDVNEQVGGYKQTDSVYSDFFAKGDSLTITMVENIHKTM